MSIDVANWQLELGGFPIGEGTAVDLTSLEAPQHETRSQDVPSTGGDARHFGRDRRTPGAWTMVMSVHEADEDSALGTLQALHAAWDDPDVRDTDGAVVPLRYRIGNRPARRVYGRTRHFTPVYSNLIFGHVPVAFSFDLADTTVYEDDQQSIELGVGSASLEDSGVEFPIEFPLLMGEPGASQTKTAEVGGYVATWATVRFQGPASGFVTDPYVHIGGSMIALDGEVPAGTTVTVSGVSWDQGAFWDDDTSAAGLLHAQTNLGSLRIKPGSHAVTFGGIDPTGTAKAFVTWHNAFTML